MKDTVLQLKDCYGRTLLWWAAAGGNTTTVEALISEYGFDSRTTDIFGRTPFWIATRKGHNAVSKLLFDDRGVIDTEQIVSDESGHDSESGRNCDICTFNVKPTDFHYHCLICAGGEWDICEDCKSRGASCAEATHTLIKRTMKDNVWVQVIS